MSWAKRLEVNSDNKMRMIGFRDTDFDYSILQIIAWIFITQICNQKNYGIPFIYLKKPLEKA